MSNSWIENTTQKVVLKSLNANRLRANAIAHNIANISTPEYKRIAVNFESQLVRALDTQKFKLSGTDRKHILSDKSALNDCAAYGYHPNDPALPSGINNVDIDYEMSQLASTQLTYTMGLRFLRGFYSKLNAAIQAKPLPLS